jgi:hypothetical protein
MQLSSKQEPIKSVTFIKKNKNGYLYSDWLFLKHVNCDFYGSYRKLKIVNCMLDPILPVVIS